MSKESIYNTLILLSLIFFGVIGSLSHIFTSGLILFLTLHYLDNKNEFFVQSSAKKLYLALCAVFFIFIIRGIFHNETWVSLESLSPMLPIPIIGLAILFSTGDRVLISAQRLENNAKIAVLMTFLIYIILSKSLAFEFGLTQHFFGRLEMFSGNPIPFSTAVFGVTALCLTNWRFSKNSDKILATAFVLIGFWLAGIESGTRGTLLAIIMSLPILVWLISQSVSLFILAPCLCGSIFLLFNFSEVTIIDNIFSARLLPVPHEQSSGIDILLKLGSSDHSLGLRIEMWTASLSAIRDNPYWGYDISNRFTALSTHLPETFNYKYSHPHNDIFASTIGAGLVGGMLSVLSLLSPVLAALLSNDNIKDRLFLAILVTGGIMTTANFNTVFFNDITAAWLVFSTYLIWNVDYRENVEQNKVR